MSWVRPHREILPQPSAHTPANSQLYDAVLMVVSQKLGRKCRPIVQSINDLGPPKFV